MASITHTKYKTNCKTCKATRGPANEALRKRIVHARWYRENGEETLREIAPEIGVSFQALFNHCDKHLRAPQSEDVTLKRTQKSLKKIEAKIDRDFELSFDHSELVPQEDFELTLSNVIKLGLERLGRGEIQVSTSQLLAAAKIKADFMAKKRGQNTEILKTMYRIAGGLKDNSDTRGAIARGGTTNDKSGDGGSQLPISQDDRAGANGSDLLHQLSAWNAPTPRPAPVPRRDLKAQNPD